MSTQSPQLGWKEALAQVVDVKRKELADCARDRPQYERWKGLRDHAEESLRLAMGFYSDGDFHECSLEWARHWIAAAKAVQKFRGDRFANDVQVGRKPMQRLGAALLLQAGLAQNDAAFASEFAQVLSGLTNKDICIYRDIPIRELRSFLRTLWNRLFASVVARPVSMEAAADAERSLAGNTARKVARKSGPRCEAPESTKPPETTDTAAEAATVRASPDTSSTIDAPAKPPPKLSEADRLFVQILLDQSEHEPLVDSRLCDLFMKRGGAARTRAVDPADFRKRVVPKLKAWGAENFPRIGYYFPAEALARRVFDTKEPT